MKKVLVIPEDPTLDRYILKPIVEQIFTDLGKQARVQVLSNPRLRGVSQALDTAKIADIIQNHKMMDLFLVMVDRDGDLNRSQRAAELEASQESLFVCLAIEEVEVWMLAAHRNTLADNWREIRQDPHPKERYAHPFLAEHAPKLDPGQGRASAMRELSRKNWKGVLSACEELDALQRRIDGWIQTGTTTA